MGLNEKGLRADSTYASGIFYKIQITITLALIVRVPLVCNAENSNAVAIYDPNSVKNARQECNGEKCCSPPYEIVFHQTPLWSFAKTNYTCCVPNAARNKKNCCPHPLIPSKEPNVDPAFGPFCCDPETGHCCSKLIASILSNQKPDYVYSDPIDGMCCVAYDPSRKVITCCPRPMLGLVASAAHQVPNLKSPFLMCCSLKGLCYALNFHYDLLPLPRLCSPRGFCCPWPYAPLINLISPLTYIDGIPQYKEENDNKCASPARVDEPCILPQVPWYKSCIEQHFVIEVSQQDTPLYDVIPHEFSNPDRSTTAPSSNLQCLKNDVFRRTYGNPFVKMESHSVAIDWFVTSPYVQRSKLISKTYVRKQIWKWPDVLIPFVFPITIVTISVATALPALLLGAICWALMFNFRFLWIKKVRMAIRGILVCIEKRRRIIQDNYLPPEDQRKFHARDRYQLPKALQDSDRSDDDEPEDLRRHRVDVIESHWTAEEIDALGFDPDNIPVDWIYGDLLGNPSALRKEVKAYNITARASGKPMLIEDDDTMKQLDFGEWLHFTCKGQLGTKDGSEPQGTALDKNKSVQRYKSRKKAKRRKVRVQMKPSEPLDESPSETQVSQGKKKKIHKSKNKKRSRRKRTQ